MELFTELLPHLQAEQQVETWFPDDAQLQARQQAQMEANTSLLAALHATGDLKAAASLAEGVTESASRLARKTAASAPDAYITAAHAQAMAIRLATARQVSSRLGITDAKGCFPLICQLPAHAVKLSVCLNIRSVRKSQ